MRKKSAPPINDRESGPELDLDVPREDTPEDIAAKEKRLQALLQSAKNINKAHPEVSLKKAMYLLNPLPRRSYSIEETAQILGISYNSVYRLVQKGKLHVLDVMRHKIVTAAEIDRFLNEGSGIAA